jgi:hypothetical protein
MTNWAHAVWKFHMGPLSFDVVRTEVDHFAHTLSLPDPIVSHQGPFQTGWRIQ